MAFRDRPENLQSGLRQDVYCFDQLSREMTVAVGANC